MNLEKFLHDLYEIDPSLKNKEEDLKKYLPMFLKAKPHMKVEAEFSQNLLSELLAFMSEQKEERKSFRFASILLPVLGIIAIVFAYPLFFQGTEKPAVFVADTKNIRESTMQDEFFLDDFAQSASDEVFSVESAQDGRGGGAELMGMKAILPERGERFSFSYSGDNIILSEEEMPVLKKEKSSTFVPFEEVLKQSVFAGIDVSKFENLFVGNLFLKQNEKEGYEISFNFDSGDINIHKNWEMWQDNEKKDPVFTQQNFDEKKIKKIAADFLAHYGFSLDSYAEPVLETNTATLLRDSYFPQEITLLYPLLVSSKKIYYEYGELEGMRVSVDLVSGKVGSVSGYTSPSYVSKAYPAMTDFSKILTALEKEQEKTSFIFEEDEEKNDEVKMGTPEQVFLKYSRYTTASPQEYLVPALAFSLEYPENTPEWQRKKVKIVPLISDMFEKMYGEKEGK